jgi:hypothetical protein
MNIRRFRAPHEAGAVTYAEIAAETGCDWRTVKKYLDADAPAFRSAGSSREGPRGTSGPSDPRSHVRPHKASRIATRGRTL